jgi:hypothetical protein
MTTSLQKGKRRMERKKERKELTPLFGCRATRNLLDICGRLYQFWAFKLQSDHVLSMHLDGHSNLALEPFVMSMSSNEYPSMALDPSVM